MLERRYLGNQKGFTLIEIISVLVLLGILSAYAVPKYFSMQEAAEEKIVQAALSDMNSKAVMNYGQLLLEAGDLTGGQNSFADLDLDTPLDVYKDYPGTWAYADPNITYAYKFKPATTTITFTFGAGDADGPITITTSTTGP